MNVLPSLQANCSLSFYDLLQANILQIGIYAVGPNSTVLALCHFKKDKVKTQPNVGLGAYGSKQAVN